MGLLIEGVWHNRWYDTQESGGRFIRPESQYRNWITADGEAGPTGIGGFKAEAGRYHLYVSLACPWAHRTLIFRAIKGLEGMISISIVHWLMGAEGWTFQDGPGVIPDTINGAARLSEIYTKANSHYSGRVSVPVLWDGKQKTIVNNESAEIIRMLNSAFDPTGAKEGDYYPHALRGQIDSLNSEIYSRVNNGVYKAGFATTQAAYEEAVNPLFETLDKLEARLMKQRYLCGERITEADWRLLTTLLRFDAVYYGHFKCNLRRIADYSALSGYVRELYQWPGVRETVNFHHIKHHYYESHRTINPTGIVPVGPALDFDAPHKRDDLAAG